MDENKKIEPTDAMVDEAANATSIDGNGTPLHRRSDGAKRAYLKIARIALRAGLSHPDARGLFTDEDDRPWEPLNGGPVRVGDEVRRESSGLTTTAVVGRVDKSGELWTAEGAYFGLLRYGTWYVRRPVQDLPTEDGAVIIPADGHECIATNEGIANALVHLGGKWYGGPFQIKPEQITPGTWQEASK